MKSAPTMVALEDSSPETGNVVSIPMWLAEFFAPSWPAFTEVSKWPSIGFEVAMKGPGEIGACHFVRAGESGCAVGETGAIREPRVLQVFCNRAASRRNYSSVPVVRS